MTKPKIKSNGLQTQYGLSLLELLVGLVLGMLIVIAGLSSLLAVRGVSSTVSEAGMLQMQASAALRIIGQQIRQTGGRMLKPAADPMEFAVFDENTALSSFVPVQGKEAPSSSEFALEVLFQNASEHTLPLLNGAPQLKPLLRNCLGESTDPASTPVVLSRFRRQGNDLVCAGSGAAQVLISGVADFQVRYLLQTSPDNNTPVWKYVAADVLTSPALWKQVYAVQVCLELVGTEPIDTAGTTYTRCDRTESPRNNRLHMVFRNNYFINNRIWMHAS